jgi:hypothetical protein
MVSRSCMGSLPGNKGLNPAAHQALIPECMTKLLFERPDARHRQSARGGEPVLLDSTGPTPG